MAGLKNSCPTWICPFFGDQFFWGEVVNREGLVIPATYCIFHHTYIHTSYPEYIYICNQLQPIYETIQP